MYFMNLFSLNFKSESAVAYLGHGLLSLIRNSI